MIITIITSYDVRVLKHRIFALRAAKTYRTENLINSKIKYVGTHMNTRVNLGTRSMQVNNDLLRVTLK